MTYDLTDDLLTLGSHNHLDSVARALRRMFPRVPVRRGEGVLFTSHIGFGRGSWSVVHAMKCRDFDEYLITSVGTCGQRRLFSVTALRSEREGVADYIAWRAHDPGITYELYEPAPMHDRFVMRPNGERQVFTAAAWKRLPEHSHASLTRNGAYELHLLNRTDDELRATLTSGVAVNGNNGRT